jgi:hypothetical protein
MTTEKIPEMASITQPAFLLLHNGYFSGLFTTKITFLLNKITDISSL